MPNEIKISNPSDIHKLFKFIRDNTDFFKLPKFEAFLHSFRTLETIHLNIELRQKYLEDFFLAELSLQDTMQYLIYWIYRECPEGGRYVLTKDSQIKKIIPIIKLAYNYSKIHDFIVAVQKSWAIFHINEKQKLVSFKYKDLEKSFLFNIKLKDRLIRQAQNTAELQKELDKIEGMKEALNQLQDSVTITKDRELKYRTNRFILDKFKKFSILTLEKEFMFPESWSIGPYSIGNFRTLWIELNKLSLIHVFALRMSIMTNRIDEIGFLNNSIFRISKSSLLYYVKKHTSLIKEIIQDLIYNIALPHVDIMHQPLIEMNKNEIFFSPTLILNSFVERNLQVLLTKLPHRKTEYDRLKNLKEDKMIQDITEQLKINGFYFHPKIKLKENSRIITDIDLLIWDQNYKDFLIVQLKWFYGADSTQEIYNQDQRFEEGIVKTIKSIQYLKSNFWKVASLIKIPFSEGLKKVFGIIVSKMGTPSPFIENPDFPIIEEHDFFEFIKKSDSKVENLYKIILSSIESKKRVPKLKESFVEIMAGDFKFMLPAIEY